MMTGILSPRLKNDATELKITSKGIDLTPSHPISGSTSAGLKKARGRKGNATSPDSVELLEDEYVKFVESAYGGAFSKEAKPATPPTVTEMEERLLGTVELGPEALPALSQRRAEMARDRLLKGGQVNASRLFIVEGGEHQGEGSARLLHAEVTRRAPFQKLRRGRTRCYPPSLADRLSSPPDCSQYRHREDESIGERVNGDGCAQSTRDDARPTEDYSQEQDEGQPDAVGPVQGREQYGRDGYSARRAHPPKEGRLEEPTKRQLLPDRPEEDDRQHHPPESCLVGQTELTNHRLDRPSGSDFHMQNQTRHLDKNRQTNRGRRVVPDAERDCGFPCPRRW
jgi:hypothetical protein